jgi:ADP-ribose pyrophosphatase YjhB (NUDIX family)
MTTEHFSGGEMPHTPQKRLSDELYEGVEKNIVYACTDVALRDPETGKIFLGSRQTEPQIGPWFIGGRNVYGESIGANASMQVENDLGLKLSPSRFRHIATYSTEFPIASPGKEEHGRHTMNATMVADLTPDEVKELDRRSKANELRDEYSGGEWYDLDEIADPETDFPFALKQFARDLFAHEIGRNALHELALIENEVRDEQAAEEKEEDEENERIASLVLLFDISHDEASILERVSGANSAYAIAWAKTANDEYSGDSLDLVTELGYIAEDMKLGDVALVRKLKSLGITKPIVQADNGPALRAILKGAKEALLLDIKNEGAIFRKIGALTKLGQTS